MDDATFEIVLPPRTFLGDLQALANIVEGVILRNGAAKVTGAEDNMAQAAAVAYLVMSNHPLLSIRSELEIMRDASWEELMVEFPYTQMRGLPVLSVKLSNDSTPVMRFIGQIKSFNVASAYGFIECELTYEEYGRDVFICEREVGGCTTGDSVSFAIKLNARGQPQAADVSKVRSSHVWHVIPEPPLPPPLPRPA